jgi:hypothetical protein
MKNLFLSKVFLLLFFALIQMKANASAWTNYANISKITDVEVQGSKLWVVAKGGLCIIDKANNSKQFFKKGDMGLPTSQLEQIATRPADGSIWIGTYDSGLVKWTGSDVETYPLPGAGGVFGNLLFRMKFDANSNLWVQTSFGLYKFNTTTHNYTFVNSLMPPTWGADAWDFDINMDNEALVFNGERVLKFDCTSNSIIDSFELSTSPAVLGCFPASVRVYDIDSNTYLFLSSGAFSFQHHDGTYSSADMGLPVDYTIKNVIRGSDNMLFCMIYNMSLSMNEIYRLDGTTWNLVLSNLNNSEYLFEKTTSILMSSELDYATFYEYNTTGTQLFNCKKYEQLSNNQSGICVTTDGKTVAFNNGKLIAYNAINDDWDVVSTVPTIFGAFQNLSAKNNKIYGVNYGNLILIYDGVNWTQVPLAAGYVDKDIYGYDIQNDGAIYFVNSEGVFKYKDGITNNIVNVSGAGSWVLNVKHDESRNGLWMLRSNAIEFLNFTTGVTSNYTSANIADLAAGAYLQSIAIDANNNVIVGGNNMMVYTFNGTDWSSHQIINLSSSHEGFVTQIIPSQNNTIFFKINEGDAGIVKYDGVNYTYIHSSLDNTIVSDVVAQMALDNDGNTWTAHPQNGISFLRNTSNSIVENNFESIEAFPSPTSQFVYFNISIEPDAKAKIYNGLGQEVYGCDINTTEHKIDVSKLANGIYTVAITTNTKNYTAKFVKN